MLSFFKPLSAIGIEQTSNQIKGAQVVIKNKRPCIVQLLDFLELDNVKPLYTDHSLLVTGIQSCDVLIRSLYLPVKKEKDIDATLAFQMEPLLPYPSDQAILARQILNRDADGTQLTVLAVKKDLLQKHLEQWQQIKIEPEKVTCIQSALCHFGQYYIDMEKPYLILHMDEKWMTCVLVQQGRLIASYAHQEGFSLFRKAIEQDEQSDESTEAIKRLQQAITKMGYALRKEDTPEGIVLVGETALFPYLEEKLVEKLNLPILQCMESEESTSEEKRRYAVPIGLAIGALQNQINFRQHEFSYPYPWKRIRAPLMTYFACMALFTLTFYFFSQVYLHHREQQLKQEYVNLLAEMNKSHENFELAFLAKNPVAREKTGGEVVDIIQLKREELLERLEFLQKDLQATPDSFPLFANIPRVTDVLAWLANHPYIVHKDEHGNIQPRLQLESFTYTMLKRPVQGKKQEKYQVKVELDFTTPMPKWAREFHDALIAPNDFVDPKGEVKWNTNRGCYHTSFYLKDKTLYPNP